MRMARPLFGCGVGQMWGLLDDVFASLPVTVTFLVLGCSLDAAASVGEDLPIGSRERRNPEPRC